MKTCEEYVLQELEAVQGKIAELKKDREKLQNSFDVLFEFLTVLKKYIFIADGSNGRRYIEMRYVFEDFDFNDFEVLERILLLLEEMEHDG